MLRILKKCLTALIIGSLVVLIFMTVFGKVNKDDKQEDWIKSTKKAVKEMIVSIYESDSVKELNKSKEKYDGKVVTNEIAEELYRTTKDDITEADKGRSCYVTVKYSERENNSNNKGMFKASVQVYYNSSIVKDYNIRMYVNDESKLIEEMYVENADK